MTHITKGPEVKPCMGVSCIISVIYLSTYQNSFKSSSCVILSLGLGITKVRPIICSWLEMLSHMETWKNGNPQQCGFSVGNPPKQIYILQPLKWNLKVMMNHFHKRLPFWTAGGEFRWSASWSVELFIQIDQMVHVTCFNLLIFNPPWGFPIWLIF